MARDAWHITRDERTLTLSRTRDVRFDLAQLSFIPGEGLSRSRLAHQIRQDMWRKLQRLRGFSPAVRITVQDGGMAVLAGGAVNGPVTRRAAETIADMLDDPDLRARWIKHARRRT